MAERIIFQSASNNPNPFKQAGTLEDWQAMAALAVGNSRLGLALSAAFAASLLYPTGMEGGGFHFRGNSSSGKTTLLQAAGSAWGGGSNGYVRTLRATSNGLEGVCALHCDSLLCLDELGMIDGKEAGNVAYMLASGVGKMRAGQRGEARPPAEWRILFISSGEISLADKMAEDVRGIRAAAGQQVRVLDIPVDAGAGLGAWENLHGFANGDAFARHIKAASLANYGHAARAFLVAITKDFDNIAPQLKDDMDAFYREALPLNCDGQVSRAAQRFALVGAAGEMAARLGILPWPEGEAINAAKRCFKDWLAGRGGIGSAEKYDHLATVRKFIELHGTSRFEPMGSMFPTDGAGEPLGLRIVNRAGYRQFRSDARDYEYLITPEVWKSEVCKGLDASAVAKTLANLGMMDTEKGRWTKLVRLPGNATATRVYVVTSKLFEDA